MIVSLTLSDFRSFVSKKLEFDPHQTLIIGPNGAGKTNILEAIALLSIGRSIHSLRLIECVRQGAAFSRLELSVRVDGEDEVLSILINAKGSGSHAHLTHYQRSGITKQKRSVVGFIKVVLFSPEDLGLIIGSPARKRDFLNDVLTQADAPYAHALAEYQKALKNRNKLLEALREGRASRADFIFWDELLIRHGDVITRKRFEFVHFLNDVVLFPVKMQMVYEESLMSGARLRQYATAEVGAGRTLVGPHRDTFHILYALQSGEAPQDVQHFGSRGQQRLSVLWLKMAQLRFIEKQTGTLVTLLLDDIFSELDPHNRKFVFSLFEGRQVIMTSAEPIEVLPEQVRDGKIIALT